MGVAGFKLQFCSQFQLPTSRHSREQQVVAEVLGGSAIRVGDPDPWLQPPTPSLAVGGGQRGVKQAGESLFSFSSLHLSLYISAFEMNNAFKKRHMSKELMPENFTTQHVWESRVSPVAGGPRSGLFGYNSSIAAFPWKKMRLLSLSTIKSSHQDSPGPVPALRPGDQGKDRLIFNCGFF